MSVKTTKKEVANSELKTPQSIVHIKHSITLRQYKYWVLILHEFKKQIDGNIEFDKNGFYRFPISLISDYLGYEPVKTELKKDIEALRREPIIINLLDKDGQSATRGMGFISEWEITSKTVAFKLPSFLEDVMKGLDDHKTIFSLLNWNIFNHFSGKYEAIIYKLCKDYIGIGRTPTMLIPDFRDYIGLKDGEYPEFKKLNLRVISGPVSKINKSELSDILINPVFLKQGRTVTGLYFEVQHKKQTQIPFPEIEPNPAFEATKFPISPIDQERFLKLRSPEEIKLCIKRVNDYKQEQEKLNKPVKFLGKLYEKSIIEGWHIEEAYRQSVKESHSAKKQAILEATKNNTDEQERINEKKRRALEIFNSFFENLSSEEKENLYVEFEATKEGASALKATQKYTLEEKRACEIYLVQFRIFVVNSITR